MDIIRKRNSITSKEAGMLNSIYLYDRGTRFGFKHVVVILNAILIVSAAISQNGTKLWIKNQLLVAGLAKIKRGINFLKRKKTS